MRIQLIFSEIVVIMVAIALSHCTSPAGPKDTAAVIGTDTTTAIVPADTAQIAVHPKAHADTTAVAVHHAPAVHIPLTLIITGLASPDAPVIVGLYGAGNKFPDPNGQLKVYQFTPHGLTLTTQIADQPFGEYALAIYQDVNSNGKIDKNMIGMPTEPYAFSNNYKPTVKAPGFKNCKFDYDSISNSVTMKMIK